MNWFILITVDALIDRAWAVPTLYMPRPMLNMPMPRAMLPGRRAPAAPAVAPISARVTVTVLGASLARSHRDHRHHNRHFHRANHHGSPHVGWNYDRPTLIGPVTILEPRPSSRLIRTRFDRGSNGLVASPWETRMVNSGQRPRRCASRWSQLIHLNASLAADIRPSPVRSGADGAAFSELGCVADGREGRHKPGIDLDLAVGGGRPEAEVIGIHECDQVSDGPFLAVVELRQKRLHARVVQATGSGWPGW